jgi:hypothetical protein
LPTFDIKGLLGGTFITNPTEEGEQHRAEVVEACSTGETTADGQDAMLRFKCKHGDRFLEEVMSYNKMLELCDRDLDKDNMHQIEAILPDTIGDWEVRVQWASGVTTWNALNLTLSNDSVSVSIFATHTKLLQTPGWKRCKPCMNNAKKFGRMINQAKFHNFCRQPIYKYGHQVPRDHPEVEFIDQKNGNSKRQDAEKTEVWQLKDYDTFRDLGLGAPRPEGFIMIPCHLVYDCKHNGHLT